MKMHPSVFLRALFSSNTHFFLYLVATYTNFKQKTAVLGQAVHPKAEFKEEHVFP